MAEIVHVKARLVPWDDSAFVQAYERAHAEVQASGCCAEGQEAAFRVQHLLHERGYPAAHIDVERSVDEALAHVSHWTVRRDG